MDPDGAFSVRDTTNVVVYESRRERDDPANGPWALRMGNDGNVQVTNTKVIGARAAG